MLTMLCEQPCVSCFRVSASHYPVFTASKERSRNQTENTFHVQNFTMLTLRGMGSCVKRGVREELLKEVALTVGWRMEDGHG